MTGLVNFASEPGSVELREVPVPELDEESLLLSVQAVGVCGSDLHQFAGTQSWPVNYPVILGHEFSGVVAKVGRRVIGFKEGDRVVSETAAVLPADSAYLRRGLYNLEPKRLGFGVGVDGAMASFVRVPARCLHHLPDSLDFERAALAEPCCVAYNAVCVNSRILPGETVAVIGPGPIGLLCAQMAKLSGAGHIIAIGVSADAERLNIGRRIGVNTSLDAHDDDIAEWVRNFGDGNGIDLVIDATGASASLKLALDIVRPAGQITKVGWGPQPFNHSLDQLVQKAVTLKGSFSHNWPIWETVIVLLASGKIDLNLILNRVAPLEEWRGIFEEMQSLKIVKGVLKP
jgi:L-iditol 2-dehydrogenase